MGKCPLVFFLKFTGVTINGKVYVCTILEEVPLA